MMSILSQKKVHPAQCLFSKSGWQCVPPRQSIRSGQVSCNVYQRYCNSIQKFAAQNLSELGTVSLFLIVRNGFLFHYFILLLFKPI